MQRIMDINATIGSLETIAELDAYVTQRKAEWPMDSATQSLVALRRIELMKGAK